MSDRPWLFDKQGNPLTVDQFSALIHETVRTDYHRVAETDVGDVWLSTVWLGHDVTGGDPRSDLPPLIFETMGFRDGQPDLDIPVDRWPTEEAALAGHDQRVAELRAVQSAIAAGPWFVDVDDDDRTAESE